MPRLCNRSGHATLENHVTFHDTIAPSSARSPMPHTHDHPTRPITAALDVERRSASACASASALRHPIITRAAPQSQSSGILHRHVKVVAGGSHGPCVYLFPVLSSIVSGDDARGGNCEIRTLDRWPNHSEEHEDEGRPRGPRLEESYSVQHRFPAEVRRSETPILAFQHPENRRYRHAFDGMQPFSDTAATAQQQPSPSASPQHSACRILCENMPDTSYLWDAKAGTRSSQRWRGTYEHLTFSSAMWDDACIIEPPLSPLRVPHLTGKRGTIHSEDVREEVDAAAPAGGGPSHPFHRPDAATTEDDEDGAAGRVGDADPLSRRTRRPERCPTAWYPSASLFHDDVADARSTAAPRIIPMQAILRQRLPGALEKYLIARLCAHVDRAILSHTPSDQRHARRTAPTTGPAGDRLKAGEGPLPVWFAAFAHTPTVHRAVVSYATQHCHASGGGRNALQRIEWPDWVPPPGLSVQFLLAMHRAALRHGQQLMHVIISMDKSKANATPTTGTPTTDSHPSRWDREWYHRYADAVVGRAVRQGVLHDVCLHLPEGILPLSAGDERAGGHMNRRSSKPRRSIARQQQQHTLLRSMHTYQTLAETACCPGGAATEASGQRREDEIQEVLKHCYYQCPLGEWGGASPAADRTIDTRSAFLMPGAVDVVQWLTLQWLHTCHWSEKACRGGSPSDTPSSTMLEEPTTSLAIHPTLLCAGGPVTSWLERGTAAATSQMRCQSQITHAPHAADTETDGMMHTTWTALQVCLPFRFLWKATATTYLHARPVDTEGRGWAGQLPHALVGSTLWGGADNAAPPPSVRPSEAILRNRVLMKDGVAATGVADRYTWPHAQTQVRVGAGYLAIQALRYVLVAPFAHSSAGEDGARAMAAVLAIVPKLFFFHLQEQEVASVLEHALHTIRDAAAADGFPAPSAGWPAGCPAAVSDDLRADTALSGGRPHAGTNVRQAARRWFIVALLWAMFAPEGRSASQTTPPPHRREERRGTTVADAGAVTDEHDTRHTFLAASLWKRWLIPFFSVHGRWWWPQHPPQLPAPGGAPPRADDAVTRECTFLPPEPRAAPSEAEDVSLQLCADAHAALRYTAAWYCHTSLHDLQCVRQAFRLQATTDGKGLCQRAGHGIRRPSPQKHPQSTVEGAEDELQSSCAHCNYPHSGHPAESRSVTGTDVDAEESSQPKQPFARMPEAGALPAWLTTPGTVRRAHVRGLRELLQCLLRYIARTDAPKASPLACPLTSTSERLVVSPGYVYTMMPWLLELQYQYRDDDDDDTECEEEDACISSARSSGSASVREQTDTLQRSPQSVRTSTTSHLSSTVVGSFSSSLSSP